MTTPDPGIGEVSPSGLSSGVVLTRGFALGLNRGFVIWRCFMICRSVPWLNVKGLCLRRQKAVYPRPEAGFPPSPLLSLLFSLFCVRRRDFEPLSEGVLPHGVTGPRADNQWRTQVRKKTMWRGTVVEGCCCAKAATTTTTFSSASFLLLPVSPNSL